MSPCTSSVRMFFPNFLGTIFPTYTIKKLIPAPEATFEMVTLNNSPPNIKNTPEETASIE